MSTIGILITPAPDCRAPGARVPPARATPSRATIEYDLLVAAPYTLDHKAFSHAVHVAVARAAGRPAQSFEDFHAKGQPCMRASPLTKSYGWAAHYDDRGRLALLDPAGADFARLAADPAQPRAAALRSRRA